MRGVRKLALALALAALLAAAFSACGGGDSAGSSAASTAASTPSEGSVASGGGQSVEPKGDKGKRGASSGGGSSAAGDGASSDEGSASFRSPGGDNSIQDFGEEADSSEREEAAAALTAFLEGREKGDWAAQCDNLAKAAIAPLEQLASRSPQIKGKSCAGAIEALIGGALPPRPAPTH